MRNIQYKNKEWLKTKYCIEELTQTEIANICNANQGTISNWLRNFNIIKPPKLYQNDDWLKDKYINKKMSAYQIGLKCGISNGTIYKRLKKINIKRRTLSESIRLANSNHCNLSQEAKEWIDGELLGDGCIVSRYQKSGKFLYGSKYEEYINYISSALNSFGINQSGKIHRKCYKKWNNCCVYHYQSLYYAELYQIYHRWYPNGKKVVPKDLKLTPLTCRQWYIGDGSLVHLKNRRKPHIQLSTCGFLISDVDWLMQQLNIMGFKSTRVPSRNEVHISTYSTKDFLDYIGTCPAKCYQYKWRY